MLSPKRIAFILALAAATSVSLILVTALSKGKATVTANPKIKVLRRKDQKHVKPTAAELAAFRQQSEAEREIEDKIPKHVPIKIKLKADKEKAFKDLNNPKWYRDFELEVTNTSDKPIYYLDVWLVYPEINAGRGAPVAVPLRYGRMNFIYQDTRPLPTDVPIKPGETHVFAIPEKARKGWEWHKRNENTPDPRKTLLWFVHLSFGDGTGFSGTDAKAYPYKRDKTSALPCREGPAQVVATGPVSVESFGLQVTPRNDLFFPITGRLSAGYFSAFNGGYSFLANSSSSPDACCGSGCYFMKESMDSCACGDSQGFSYPGCSDPQATCGTPAESGYWCDDYGVYCPEFTRGPCPNGTPSPTPTATPTPSPSPTPTPCPQGSFNPDQNGNCPLYANNINGCCVCQERNTDCSRFGQGQWPSGDDYCIWVEHFCECRNIEGPCAENPRPSPTPTETPVLTSGGGDGNEPGDMPESGCSNYYWVWFASSNGGQTWTPTGQVDYAGCW